MTAATPDDGAALRPSADRDEPEDSESLPQRELRTLVGGICADCGTRYSAREAVISIFLGRKDSPRCLSCTGRRLERGADELCADFLAHIQGRECYLKAWQEAERIDGVVSAPAGGAARAVAVLADGSPGPPVDAEWDAGDMGCGELVMALRLRMEQLPRGGIIRVRATDAAAPEDLPAWCRLCGHTLVLMHHPNYWIRRKGA